MQHGARQNERPSGRRPSANGARHCPTRFTGMSSADPRDDAARQAPPLSPALQGGGGLTPKAAKLKPMPLPPGSVCLILTLNCVNPGHLATLRGM